MRRIMLTVAYDGTNYCGWQIQPTGITIEEVLNQALSHLFMCLASAERIPACMLWEICVCLTQRRGFRRRKSAMR